MFYLFQLITFMRIKPKWIKWSKKKRKKRNLKSEWTWGSIHSGSLSTTLSLSLRLPPSSLSLSLSLSLRTGLGGFSRPALRSRFLRRARKLPAVCFRPGAAAIRKHSAETHCKVETARQETFTELRCSQSQPLKNQPSTCCKYVNKTLIYTTVKRN